MLLFARGASAQTLPFAVMVCERADDARCGHHRRWPQRSCLLRLSGDGRSQGIGARSAPRRRRSRGYGRVQPRLRNSVTSYAVSLLNPKIIRDPTGMSVTATRAPDSSTAFSFSFNHATGHTHVEDPHFGGGG